MAAAAAAAAYNELVAALLYAILRACKLLPHGVPVVVLLPLLPEESFGACLLLL